MIKTSHSAVRPVNPDPEEVSSPNCRRIGCAIAIIIGIGGLCVATAGLPGVLDPQRLSSSGITKSVTMTATGLAVGCLCLCRGVKGFFADPSTPSPTFSFTPYPPSVENPYIVEGIELKSPDKTPPPLTLSAPLDKHELDNMV